MKNDDEYLQNERKCFNQSLVEKNFSLTRLPKENSFTCCEFGALEVFDTTKQQVKMNEKIRLPFSTTIGKGIFLENRNRKSINFLNCKILKNES